MERREFLGTVGMIGGTGLAGCTGASDTDDMDSPPESSPAGESSDSPSESDTESTDDENEENCEMTEQSNQEVLIDRSYELSANGPSTVNDFTVAEEDTIAFDIQTTNQQEIDLTIESPLGGSEFEGTVADFSNEVGFSTSGDGRILINNAGTATNEHRSQLWADSDTLSAGEFYSGWVTLEEGTTVDYFIRQLGDGARPKLVIENESRNVVQEEPVAAVIDDEFTAPETGEYYFQWENTAILTSGSWRWEFESISEEVIPAMVTVHVERKFVETVEVCE